MVLRRYISLFVLLMMLTTQGAVAHHFSVHAAEGGAGHTQDEHGQQPDAGDLCDLCLLAKSMAQAAGPSPVLIPAPAFSEISFAAQDSVITAAPATLSYAARAPPIAA